MNDPALSPRHDLQSHDDSTRTKWSPFFKASLAVLVLLSMFAIWNVRRDPEFWQSILEAEDLNLHTTNLQTTTVQRPPVSPFDLQNPLVPIEEIRHGGPPKDGIPALSNPSFVTPREAIFLKPQDRVIGITLGEEARAYPLSILNYHEIVNDRLGKTPIAVTYCPLCDSAVVFDRRTPVGEREFGVSGLLYNSNVLMYDRGGDPESLWSQLMSTGISAAGKNLALKTLPLELTAWADWLERNPNTLVLSTQTGHLRDYRSSPYSAYFRSPTLMFPVNRTDDRLPMKVPVLGIWTEKASKAYPLSAFPAEQIQLKDEVGGIPVTLEYRPEPGSLRVVSAGQEIQWLYSLWFAWFAFHPETDIYQR